MSTMRKTLAIAAPIVALILIAVLILVTTLNHTHTPAAPQRAHTAPTTTQPTPTTTRTARGPAASTLTTDITPLEQRAAAFVLTAATPDTRLDPTPTAAWKRAAIYATPNFAHQLAAQKDLTTDQWWRDMAAHDGWVSVRITNILGADPQHPSDQATEPDTLQVVFLPTYHTTVNGQDHTVNDQQPHTWTLHLDGDRINDIDPDAEH